MKRALCLLLFMFVVSPLLVMAADEDAKPENGEALVQTKAMIKSRVFMERDGIEKMQAVSSNLSEEWRETEYVQNKKIRALGWLSLLVPSLGNWIVGDKVGGVVTIVGTGGGVVTYLVGYGMFFSSAYSAAASASANRSSSYSVDYTGFYVMLAGLGIMIVFDIYSVISALSYAGTYNDNLRSGLGLTYNDSIEFGQKAMAEALNLPKPAPELIHLNLVSISF